MKKLILKLTPALLFGLSLTLSLLGLMTYLHPKTVHAAGPHHVAPSCAGVPAPCYTNVQAAVDAAAPGDVIKVAAGTYTGVTSRAGVTQTVYISKSVTLRGGYTTAFTEPPDSQANPTTLDAQGQGRVMYIIGNITPTIEGLRITGGDATAGGMGDNGGGVFVSQAAAVFSNNQIFGNVADSFNISSGFGGGVFLGMDSSVLNRNIIIGNTASHGGGGLLLIDSKATLNGNTITSNEACIIGGGLDILYSDVGVTLNNNTVTNNTANSFCSNNPTNGTGGGIVLDFNSHATFINNLIADNTANIQGSGLYIRASSARLLHTTMARNSGGDGSGIFITELTGPDAGYSTVTLSNTILVSQSVGITVTAGNTVTLNSTLWSDNPANWGGAGTINTVNNYSGGPAFVNPNGGDFHLSFISAAINKGINTGVTSDIDGQSRPQGAGFDLGADEYPAPAISIIGVAINGPVTGTPNIASVFTATVSPVTATLPIAYTWSPAPINGQGTATATYAWPTIGIKAITVTVTNGDGFISDTHLVPISAPVLSLRKSGPTTAAPGDLITYTVTVTNSGNLTATQLVITDTVPANATYINGGTKVGNVVSWTIPSLAASGGVTQTTFVVTATQTITNSDYGVRADGGYTAQGSVAVVTAINAQAPESKVFVPVILKQ